MKNSFAKKLFLHLCPTRPCSSQEALCTDSRAQRVSSAAPLAHIARLAHPLTLALIRSALWLPRAPMQHRRVGRQHSLAPSSRLCALRHRSGAACRSVCVSKHSPWASGIYPAHRTLAVAPALALCPCTLLLCCSPLLPIVMLRSSLLVCCIRLAAARARLTLLLPGARQARSAARCFPFGA